MANSRIVTMQMHRDDDTVATMNGVMSYFPKVEGHGEDDYLGKYTISSFEGLCLNLRSQVVRSKKKIAHYLIGNTFKIFFHFLSI